VHNRMISSEIVATGRVPDPSFRSALIMVSARGTRSAPDAGVQVYTCTNVRLGHGDRCVPLAKGM
jgi:hypothetical protein